MRAAPTRPGDAAGRRSGSGVVPLTRCRRARASRRVTSHQIQARGMGRGLSGSLKREGSMPVRKLWPRGVTGAALVAMTLTLASIAVAAPGKQKPADRSPSAGTAPAKAKPVDRAPSAKGRNAPSDIGPVTGGMQHGPMDGHLPGSSENVELIGELEPLVPFGAIAPGQIADLAVYKGFAYLNSWNEPTCTKGGFYAVDIRDPRNPAAGRLRARAGGQVPRRGRARDHASTRRRSRRPARRQQRARDLPRRRRHDRWRLRPLRRERSEQPEAARPGRRRHRRRGPHERHASRPTPTTACSCGRTTARSTSSAPTTRSSTTSTSWTSRTRGSRSRSPSTTCWRASRRSRRRPSSRG